MNNIIQTIGSYLPEQIIVGNTPMTILGIIAVIILFTTDYKKTYKKRWKWRVIRFTRGISWIIVWVIAFIILHKYILI